MNKTDKEIIRHWEALLEDFKDKEDIVRILSYCMEYAAILTIASKNAELKQLNSISPFILGNKIGDENLLKHTDKLKLIFNINDSLDIVSPPIIYKIINSNLDKIYFNEEKICIFINSLLNILNDELNEYGYDEFMLREDPEAGFVVRFSNDFNINNFFIGLN